MKISEVSGERVDHEAKLKVIAQEDAAIRKEKEVRMLFLYIHVNQGRTCFVVRRTKQLIFQYLLSVKLTGYH